MRTRTALIAVVSTCALALPAAAGPDAGSSSPMHATPAQETARGHSHERCEIHGGSSVMTPENHFEVLFTPQEVRLYVYDASQDPVRKLDGVKAAVSLTSKDGALTRLPMESVAADSAKGLRQGYFVARRDFSAAGKSSMKATFLVEGLGKKPVEFKSAVVVGEQAVYTCPMHPQVKAEEPGRCPQCGMALEKMTGAGKEHEGHGEGGAGHHH